MSIELTTEYLVIGAGASALAFVDELVSQNTTARVVVVDRRAVPGGHWNDAYDFVKLHQPAGFYGVNSRPLGKGGTDLASKEEILSYYAAVQVALEATGRVAFFLGCESDGGTTFRTVHDDREYRVQVMEKVVDTTYMNITVPSTRPPTFLVSSGVKLVPINALATAPLNDGPFMIIGSGKTGMDAIVYLLSHGVEPGRISWVMPNDAWFIDRANFFGDGLRRSLEQELRTLKACTSWTDVFPAHETSGYLMRLNPDIKPTRYRCATVDRSELEMLRRVHDVIRLGRVERIDTNGIQFQRGHRTSDPATTYVDCTADGLKRQPIRPIFETDRIVLQPVLMCQPAFSGALVGLVEARYSAISLKNELCRPVPYPQHVTDYFQSTLTSLENIDRWIGAFRWRLARMRLFIGSHISVFRLPQHLLTVAFIKAGAQKKLTQFAEDVAQNSL